MTTPLSLQALQSTQWLGSSNAAGLYTIRTDTDEFVVDTAALSVLDARLPGVVHALGDEYYKRQPAKAGRSLAATLRHWAWPVRLPEGFGHELGGRVLDVLENVYVLDADDDSYVFIGCSGFLRVVDNTEVCVDIQSFNRRFSRTWCEQHFPGSVLRIAAAAALGLNSTDIAKFAFYHEAWPQPEALPELGMDSVD